MSVVTIKEQYLTDIANAIRAKSDSTDTYTTAEMASAIDALSFSVQETIDDFLTKDYRDGIRSEVTEIETLVLAGMPMKYIELPNVTDLSAGSFSSCIYLTRADLPLLKYVRGHLFEGCSSLTDVNLPMVQSIDYSAFQNCVKLKKIDLPVCDRIGTGAFKGCSALSTVILRAPYSRVSITDDSFPGSTWVYVPSRLYDEYVAYAEAIPLPYTFKRIEDYPDICG